jgi:hypothetical protein
MAGLVPAICAGTGAATDGRDTPGHDDDIAQNFSVAQRHGRACPGHSSHLRHRDGWPEARRDNDNE